MKTFFNQFLFKYSFAYFLFVFHLFLPVVITCTFFSCCGENAVNWGSRVGRIFLYRPGVGYIKSLQMNVFLH